MTTSKRVEKAMFWLWLWRERRDMRCCYDQIFSEISRALTTNNKDKRAHFKKYFPDEYLAYVLWSKNGTNWLKGQIGRGE